MSKGFYTKKMKLIFIKYTNNAMEGIFYLLNVEYDSEKGVIVKGEETIIGKMLKEAVNDKK